MLSSLVLLAYYCYLYLNLYLPSLVLEAHCFNKYDKYIQEVNLNTSIVGFQGSMLDEGAQQWRYAYELNGINMTNETQSKIQVKIITRHA